MSLLDLLAPIRAAVEALLTALHDLLVVTGLDPADGTGWLLAVGLLTLLVRAALLPLAVRQHRALLRMRALAPDLQRLPERCRGRTDAASRRQLAAETADLQRRGGASPFGSVLPLLVQAPLFIALVQALDHAVHASAGAALASFAAATAFGAPLAAGALAGGPPAAVVGGILLLVTAGAQVLSQHLSAVGIPAAPGARLLLLLPLASAAAGLAFPIGVTAYWACSALVTLGQQALLPRVLRPA